MSDPKPATLQDGSRLIEPRDVVPSLSASTPAVFGNAQLAGILLPNERVETASRAHPIVFVKPALTFLFGAVVVLIAMFVHLHPIVDGHHVSVALYRSPLGAPLVLVGWVTILVGIVRLWRASWYFLGFHVITTNRRAFRVSGAPFRSYLVPLGNTSIGACYLAQSMLGRYLNYGTIVMPNQRLANLRDPVALYRSLQAVAQGVDGDRWDPALRTTILP